MRTSRIESFRRAATATAAIAALAAAAPAFAGISITPTTTPSALGSFVTGSGLTVDSTTIVTGDAAQFGTFSNFSGSKINVGSGVVLSTGKVSSITGVDGITPSGEFGGAGTPEFDAYAAGRVTNFQDSHDVASLKLTFTLATASAVSFSFVFGSVEFPEFTGKFTDAFLTFLDGTAASNQIVFDASNKPVQVGSSFASSLTTADTSTVFTDPHGLLGPLTTTTGLLAAGTHTLLFEVGDVNDDELDSAVFLTGLGVASGGGDGPPVTTPGGPITTPVPEPGTYALMLGGLGVVGFTARRRKKA